ncbi:MAG: CpsB/CapC family capsule biosynthesis tyrosine phosphatase [Candidatus Ancaeobacter aquaticus]|nr:CpsB/CapC family capsule biosynthesis tyrosine phosphatase [Candidatus Ancaeobacter aquaticus]
MIDLHSHILPGIDDGAKTIEESLEMGRIAYRDGIRSIVATPHTLNGVYDNSRENIIEAVHVMQGHFKDAGIDITLYPGAEVQLDDQIAHHIESGYLLTLNDMGKYIFIELPVHVIPQHLDSLFFDLKMKGITPIITHPERNMFIEKDVNILFEFVEKGVLSQITASSLTGEFGSGVKACAKKLLKCKLVHIIATDSHATTHRVPILSEGVKVASQIVGKEDAQSMVIDVPQKVINGDVFYAEDPQKQRSFFSFFNK